MPSQTKSIPFDKITDITIHGGGFREPTTLQGILSRRLNIVYGRNGSGKTSVAKAFYHYKHNSDDDPNISEFISVSLNQELTEQQKSQIYVFSEKFIEDNIKLKPNGLDTIAMIGEQAKLDTRIIETKEAKEKCDLLLENETNVNTTLAEQIDHTEQSLLSAMADDKDYAGRYKLIRGNQRKSPVNTETLKVCLQSAESISPEEKSFPLEKEALADDLQKKISMLSNTTAGEKIVWEPKFVEIEIDEIVATLNKEVMEPDLTARDKYILNLLNDPEKAHYIADTKNIIIKEGVAKCPLCYQGITDDYRKQVERKIKKALDEETENYKIELDAALEKVTDIYIPMEELPENVFGKVKTQCIVKISELNKHLYDFKQTIGYKRSKMYTPLERFPDIEAAKAAIIEINNLQQELKGILDEFNKVAEAKKKTQSIAQEENKYLCYLEHKGEFDLYKKNLDAKAVSDEAVKKLTTESDDLEKQIRDLTSQMKHTKVAKEFINECMAFIFFDNQRLVLEESDGDTYKLLSRGNAVKPGDVSIGERNILALAYFFASMFKDKANDDKYSTPALVVIDDPVSSFDAENRLGVISLIKKEVTEIITGNKLSKVLILSHDLKSVFDFTIVNSELPIERPKSNKATKKDEALFMELRRGVLIEDTKHDKNEYRKLFNNVFKYAYEEEEELGLTIGNQMRRLLEAYSSFIYQKGFSDMLTSSPEAAETLGDKDMQTFYKTYMTRLLLNSESHSDENVFDMGDWLNSYSSEDKRRTAIIVMLCLYRLNPMHVKSCLKCFEKKGAEKDWKYEAVKKWAEEGIDRLFERKTSTNDIISQIESYKVTV